MGAFPPVTSSTAHVYPSVEVVSAPTPPKITRTDYTMADGEQGTYQALRLMASAVRGECEPDYSGYQDKFNRRFANQIVAENRGAYDVVATLFYFVRDQIRYVNHPMNLQVVQDCRRTLELKTGDCVSKSVCLSTLLACLGIPSRFVAQHPNHDQSFSHVYVECEGGGGGISLDSIADGKEGRPLFGVGERQSLPDGGFEMPWKIF